MPANESVSAEIPKAILAAFNAHDLDDEFRDGKVIRKDACWKIVERPSEAGRSP